MNEERGPREGHDQQTPESPAESASQPPAVTPTEPTSEHAWAPPMPGSQPRSTVNVDSTLAMVSYPPPTGSPFVHQPPPLDEPEPMVVSGSSPTAAEPGPDSAAASSNTGSPDRQGPHGEGGPIGPSGPSGPSGLGGLGAGVTSAIVSGVFVAILVAAVFGGVAGAFLVSRRDGPSTPLPVAPAASTARPAGSIADIAAKALPSVVTIKVKGADSSGTGSGFVLRKDGYILTNNHVVDGAASTGKITVLFSDGKMSDAKIVGRDASYDLAVIRVDRRDLPVLLFGASSTVVVGDPVVAVGAPLGLDSTVTSGIVSALNRPVAPGGSGESTAAFINAIQTDAAINPGNSGGPLLDHSGRVIGVNSAIARLAGSENRVDGQSGSIGVGFAIPSDQARKTAEQLIATGRATHPVIGVLLDTSYEGEGVKIATGSRNGSPPITKGGPADKAGLKPGDVIVKFAGRPVAGPDEFVVAIRAKSVGEEVELTVRRGSSERSVKMTLQAGS